MKPFADACEGGNMVCEVKAMYPCPVCGKTASTLRSLAQHIAYTAEWFELGPFRRRWHYESHYRWLKENQVKIDYYSVKRFLEKQRRGGRRVRGDATECLR
jgi:hypothetical protein